MKKQFILFFCCLAFVVLGMAQPKSGRISEKFAKKMIHEKFFKKFGLENEKLVSFINNNSLLNRQMSTKSKRGDDWWKPDTICGYYIDDLDERHIFSYENDNCTVDLTEEWSNNHWVNALINTYSYDSLNNITEEMGKYWSSGQWINGFKGVYEYDSLNNMTSFIFQYWKFDQWVNAMKTSYVYDLQNNKTEEVGQYWDLEKWNNFEKNIYSYENNNLSKSLNQQWGGGKWEDSYNEIYTYNAQNNLTEILGQLWEDTLWENDVLKTFTYDEETQSTFCISQSWKNDQWNNEDKFILNYDTQNNLVSELSQSWESNQWINLCKSTYSYDENNNATSGFFEVWENSTWIDGDGWLSVYYNNMQSEFYVSGYKFTVTYVPHENIEVKENNLPYSVTLYPNPVTNILNVETKNHNIIPDVRIYSIQGVLLINTKGNQVDVSSLSSGIYIANVNGVCRKIVKM
jgi:hypothetical protein